jgi:hypothetical protein
MAFCYFYLHITQINSSQLCNLWIEGERTNLYLESDVCYKYLFVINQVWCKAQRHTFLLCRSLPSGRSFDSSGKT